MTVAREKAENAKSETDVGEYRLEAFEFGDAPDKNEKVVEQGDDLELNLLLYSPDGRPPAALVGIVRADGTPIYGVASEVEKAEPARIDDKHFSIRIRFDSLPLLPGNYAVRGHAMDPGGMRLCDTHELRFRVRGESRELGYVYLKHRWMTGSE